MQCIESENKPIFYLINMDEYGNEELEILEINNIINDEKNWIESTCGMSKQLVMNKKVRISKYYSIRAYLIIPDDIQILLNTLSLKPIEFGRFIKYDIGGMFRKHKDAKNPNVADYEHTHYLLLYFAGDYEGGDLIVYNDSGNERIVVHAGSTYKYVILKLGVFHESTKIERGNKYLYKLALYRKR